MLFASHARHTSAPVASPLGGLPVYVFPPAVYPRRCAPVWPAIDVILNPEWEQLIDGDECFEGDLKETVIQQRHELQPYLACQPSWLTIVLPFARGP
jgi:hypothetical protein